MMDHLAGYWRFNEKNGNIAMDSSGKGHHGIINGAERTVGKKGGALAFDGKSYVEIRDHPGLRITGDITVLAWVMKTQPSRTGISMGIVSKSEAGFWDYDLFMSTSKLEHPAFYSSSFNSPGCDIEVISSEPIILNQWHHIAVARAGSEGRIYINGKLTGTAHLPVHFPVSRRSLLIGHDCDVSGFIGLIGEVRIYSRALSSKEIKRLAEE